MKLRTLASLFVAAALLQSSCAGDRPTRTELFNENIYLEKDFLTRPNPMHAGEDDPGWLMGMTIAAVSVPTAIPDIFPGLQADLQYVRFGFTKDTMQMIDAVTPGPYDEGNVPDPSEAADFAPRVLQEWTGTHVDRQLRRNLDGEVTNFEEEYKERDWQRRQHFKVELEEGMLDDLARLSWYYDWFTSPAMERISRALVPESFHYVDTIRRESNMPGTVDWEKGDYLEWTVRMTYRVQPWYGSLLVFRSDIDTQTVDVKYSLWRRPDAPAGSEYVARPVAEKDDYQRQYGIWDYVVRNFQDEESGFIGAEILLSRFNPRLPIDYYLVDVPTEFREHPELGDIHESIAQSANAVFEQAGVEARVAFHEADEGDVLRRPGDIRYSFVWWHNNDFADVPWLGYGPSSMDPRAGEIVSATLNMNNWQGLHWYTQVTRELLEQTSDAFDEEPTSCTPGEIRPILAENVEADLQNTTLYSRMVSYMGQPPDEWVVPHDDEWRDYFHMLARDIRYFYPPYQSWVYGPRERAVAQAREAREDLLEHDSTFWEVAASLDSPTSPTGFDDFTSPGAIEAGVEFLRDARESMESHARLQLDRRVAAGLRGIDLVNGPSLLGSIADINQRCKADGTWQTLDEWEDDIRWRIAHQTSVHELGHNIGLYHNFYGSVDEPNYQKCTGCVSTATGYSSSVMDYGHHFAEVGADLGFYPYDRAALTYAYRYDEQQAVDEETDPDINRIVHPEWHDPDLDPADEPVETIHLERAYLFGSDYHEPLSPLVELFDLGTTPTETVVNAIQYYDWMYQFRNFRSYRQYWETWTYPDYAFGATYFLRRLLELWALDWNDSDLENDLRLLGVEGDPFFFQNLREEFAREMGQANRLVINFFRAILTQSNAERSYATTYDSYFGDVTRIGIIYDKFYAMLSFLGLWPADFYNWDVYAYLSYYEGDRGDPQCYSDALDGVDEMLGGAYDVYPWFLPLATMVFAQDTHSINFGDQAMKEWIAFRTFLNTEDMVDYFGLDPREEALGSTDDGHQVFHDAEGGEWVYLFLDDRNRHVVASRDRSPISFKQVWDYNEAVNVRNSGTATTYDIKYMIDYYQYFN